MNYEKLRSEVCEANRTLLSSGLVAMHSGNVSGLDRASGQLFIKPSGMDYDKLTPEAMVQVDLDSGTAAGPLKPSVDLPHHLYLYRNMQDVGAIVHTHSNYATAFAACEMAIPPVLTAIADEFGGEIPCAPYVGNSADAIGRTIVKYRQTGPAVLLAHHGVFAWGATVSQAMKAAVMVEDVAKTVFLAMQIGSPRALTRGEIKEWRERYTTRYGQ